MYHSSRNGDMAVVRRFAPVCNPFSRQQGCCSRGAQPRLYSIPPRPLGEGRGRGMRGTKTGLAGATLRVECGACRSSPRQPGRYYLFSSLFLQPECQPTLCLLIRPSNQRFCPPYCLHINIHAARTASVFKNPRYTVFFGCICILAEAFMSDTARPG